jgi:hypothetical protein
LDCDQQEAMVSAAKPGRLIGSPEQGIDFRTTQEVDQSASVPLSWYGQHPLDLSGAGWFVVSGVLEEGANRSEAQVATAGGDPAALFEIIQKGSNHGRIDLFEGQPGRRPVQTFLGELQKQAKGVPIGTDGVRTRLPLIHQALDEEVLQQRGQRGFGLHDCFSQ